MKRLFLIISTLILSFGGLLSLSACSNKYEPVFDNFPLTIEASIRWVSDRTAYLDLKITNNGKKTAWDMAADISAGKVGGVKHINMGGNGMLSDGHQNNKLKPGKTITQSVFLDMRNINFPEFHSLQVEIMVYWIGFAYYQLPFMKDNQWGVFGGSGYYQNYTSSTYPQKYTIVSENPYL